MKKLIVPILIGVLMFAAAFGGAFFYYRYQQDRAASAVRDLAEEVLGDLKREGRAPVLVARLMAVMSTAPAAPVVDEEGVNKPTVPAMSALLAVPGVVGYDMDLRDTQNRDIGWDAETRVLSVKAPSLIVTEPRIDREGIRTLSGGAWVPASGALDAATGKAALGQLLSQAREDAALGFARNTARKTLERAFAAKLREEGQKATVEVRFADEKSDDQGGDRQGAASEE